MAHKKGGKGRRDDRRDAKGRFSKPQGRRKDGIPRNGNIEQYKDIDFPEDAGAQPAQVQAQVQAAKPRKPTGITEGLVTAGKGLLGGVKSAGAAYAKWAEAKNQGVANYEMAIRTAITNGTIRQMPDGTLVAPMAGPDGRIRWVVVPRSALQARRQPAGEPGMPPGSRPYKIGRASCRERV